MQQSDGEKSDADLVVDDASEISPTSPVQNQHHTNGTASPRENGIMVKKLDHPGDRDRGMAGGAHSPRSGTSSNASTPSNKKMEEKPSTPISKSVTPNGTNGIGPSNGNGHGGPSNGGGPMGGPSGAVPVGGLVKALPKPPMNPGYPPHYLGPLNGAAPHDLQAAYGAAAAAAAAGHNLPPGMNNNYPRPPMQVGFDPHPQMRAPPLTGIAAGKP